MTTRRTLAVVLVSVTTFLTPQLTLAAYSTAPEIVDRGKPRLHECLRAAKTPAERNECYWADSATGAGP
jgi:hypothetical protein